MNPEIKQNFSEKIRLVSKELLDTLDQNIKVMLAEHARDGRLASGATIKRTMNFISTGNTSLYQEIIKYLSTLNLHYNPQLEEEVQRLAKSAQESYKDESLKRLKKSTEIARNPKLYDRMVLEVESPMATDLANFQNTLNAFVLNLKLKHKISPIEKGLWCLDGLLLLISMFIVSMWFQNPAGNYEPILVGLGLVIPLLTVGIKLGREKTT